MDEKQKYFNKHIQDHMIDAGQEKSAPVFEPGQKVRITLQQYGPQPEAGLATLWDRFCGDGKTGVVASTLTEENVYLVKFDKHRTGAYWPQELTLIEE